MSKNGVIFIIIVECCEGKILDQLCQDLFIFLGNLVIFGVINMD